MATIKESHLRKIFESYGLDEGIFDFFKKMRIRQIDKEIDSKIEKVKDPEQRAAMRKLQQTLRRAHAIGAI